MMQSRPPRKRKSGPKRQTDRTRGGERSRSKIQTADRGEVRLNRFLAMLGVGSRRACDDVIAAGRVSVDGKRVSEPGVRVVPGRSRVTLDNVALQNPTQRVVLLLNKPTGVVSTVSDPQGRPTVLGLCRKYARNRRLFPVGRLDYNTTGVILLTNDGMLCYRLTHPRYQIPRTYHVRVRGILDERKLARLCKLAAGTSRDMHGARGPVEVLRKHGNDFSLAITLHEGRNRQIHRMCESVGLQVRRLRRVSFGPITLRNLPLGAVRPLEPRELKKLRQLVS